MVDGTPGASILCLCFSPSTTTFAVPPYTVQIGPRVYVSEKEAERERDRETEMPSLTLTNPDMILPFDGERQSQTPSPPQLAYLSNINGRQYDNAPAIPPRQKKNFSRHAWTHDDVNVSRRLSDIGEELSPARSESFDDPSSPAEQGQEDHKENAHSSSSSTISAGSRRASASTETPEASGEVSAVHEVARAQANAVVGAGPATLPASSAVASAAAEGKGPGEEFTSAILSSEAERILENAKKRLNVCALGATRLVWFQDG